MILESNSQFESGALGGDTIGDESTPVEPPVPRLTPFQ